MSGQEKSANELQSQFTDDFFYFFLMVRKERIRKVVHRLKGQYPDESPEQLARRLTSSRSTLSFLGGSCNCPCSYPVLDSLETPRFCRRRIGPDSDALVSDSGDRLAVRKDIDDQSRVPETTAVIAATGIAAGTPLLVSLLEFNPTYALPPAAVPVKSHSSSERVQFAFTERVPRHFRRGKPSRPSSRKPYDEPRLFANYRAE